MCNLNLLIKAETHKNTDKFFNFLSCATAASYNSNGDGDGIYFDSNNTLVKSKNKIDLLRFRDLIDKSRFILSHQRLATHGKTAEYTQPFISKRFVFGHNGIMPSFSDGVFSDSFGFFKKFIKEFNNTRSITTSIKRIVNNQRIGSYSIFIFDKKKKELYYFKNSSTSIYFFTTENKDLLFVTTRRDNHNFFDMFSHQIKLDEIDIEDNKIYKLFVHGHKVDMKEVGEIKEAKIDITDSEESEESEELEEVYTFNGSKNNRLTIVEIKRKLDISDYYTSKCSDCDKTTSNFSAVLSEFICDDCLEEVGEETIKEVEESYL